MISTAYVAVGEGVSTWHGWHVGDRSQSHGKFTCSTWEFMEFMEIHLGMGQNLLIMWYKGWPSTLRFTGGTGFWPTSILCQILYRLFFWCDARRLWDGFFFPVRKCRIFCVSCCGPSYAHLEGGFCRSFLGHVACQTQIIGKWKLPCDTTLNIGILAYM